MSLLIKIKIEVFLPKYLTRILTEYFHDFDICNVDFQSLLVLFIFVFFAATLGILELFYSIEDSLIIEVFLELTQTFL